MEEHTIKQRWAERALQIVEGLSLIGAAISGGLTLVMAFLILYEVVARAFFGASTALATELTAYMLIGIVFLSAAYGVREAGHVRMDIVVSRLPDRWRYLLDAITSTITMVFALVLAWQGWLLAFESYQGAVTSSSALRFPVFLPQLMIPIGAGILILQLVARVIRDLSSALQSNPLVEPPREERLVVDPPLQESAESPDKREQM